MLCVLHASGMVGSLQRSGATLEFAYAASWLSREGAFPLSPRLPLREAPWQGEEVLFFFSNLLPEGAVLEALLHMQRLPRGNVYRLLESFGRECAGAFTIVPQGEAGVGLPEGGYREYTHQQLGEDLAKLRGNVPLLGSHAELRLSLAGAQNKIPVRYTEGRLWLPEGGAASTHILKSALQPAEVYPHSVQNEAFCLRLAGTLGLAVPQVTVLADPEPLLLIERYDRPVAGARIERLHQLDMCQLAGVLPSQKYESDGGPGFKACFTMVDTWSAMPAVDRLQLVDWMLLNYLLGNADAHGKNLSMLYGSDGRLRLAPAYDLLATGYWGRLSAKMAMKIGGERRPDFVHARHWQRFCVEIGLNPVQLRRRALDLCARAQASADDIMAALAVPAPLAAHLGRELRKGSERIEARLGVSG